MSSPTKVVVPGRTSVRTSGAQLRTGEPRDSQMCNCTSEFDAPASPRNDTAILATRELRKFLHHAIVDRALERNDQLWEIFHRFPAPAHGLGLVAPWRMLDIDFAVRAGEAYGGPFFRLAAIASLPGAPRHRARD